MAGKVFKWRRMRAISVMLAIFMLVSLLPFSALSLVDEQININDTDVINVDGIRSGDKLEPGEIRTGKTVTDKGDGEFEITLKAIGREFTETSSNNGSSGVDVVFVLDYTLSMGDNSRLANMKAAAAPAINDILGSNTGAATDNRVAVVSYSETANVVTVAGNVTRSGNWLTGITGTGSSRGINATNIPGSAAGYTNIMAGLNRAYQLLDERTDTSRPSVIILMTDGQPNKWYVNYTNHNLINNTGASPSTNNTYATEDSVYYTIKCMEDMKAKINNLTIYTIGFSLESVSSTGNGVNSSAVQIAYAYAAINPSEANLTSTNTTVSNYLTSLRDRLYAATFVGRQGVFTEYQVRTRTQEKGVWPIDGTYSSRALLPLLTTSVTTNPFTSTSQQNSNTGTWANTSTAQLNAIPQYIYFKDLERTQVTTDPSEAVVRIEIDKTTGSSSNRPQVRTRTVYTDPDGNGTSLRDNGTGTNPRYTGIRTAYTEYQVRTRVQVYNANAWPTDGTYSARALLAALTSEVWNNSYTSATQQTSQASFGTWANTTAVPQYVYFKDLEKTQLTTDPNEAVVRIEIDRTTNNNSNRPQARTKTVYTDPDGNGNQLLRVEGSFTNPVTQSFKAGDSLAELLAAFQSAVELITNSGPAEFVKITDVIGAQFELVGGLPAGLTPDASDSSKLTWTINNLNCLPRYSDPDAKIEHSGLIGDSSVTPNTVTFTVKLKEAAKIKANVGTETDPKYLYTNTANYDDGVNFAEFTPYAKNPYYSDGAGAGEVTGGKVTQKLKSTGWATLVAIPASYSVTVNYWVKSAGGSYWMVSQRTVVQDGYEDGADYTFANIGASVPDSINFHGRNYYFDFGDNDKTGAEIFYAVNAANLEGTIDKADVEINLYYSRLALPDIPVTKSVDKYSDATYPSDYSFTFALYLGDGTKVTEDLTIAKADIGTTKYFTWDLPAGMRAANLRDATLYIREESAANWSSSVMGEYVVYGTLDRLVGYQPATAYSNGNITNDYDQPRDPPVINLRKFFTGYGAELLPEFDGAVLVCEEDARDPSAAVYGDVWVECDEYECQEEHDHFYNEEEESFGFWDYQMITAEDPGHIHDNTCYAYEFTFELWADTKIVEKTVQIPYERMLELLDDPDDYYPVSFGPLSTDYLPEAGAAPESHLYLTIIESSDNYGWLATTDAGGIVVDPYGTVTYPDIDEQAVDYVKMLNEFEGIRIPAFSFAKAVVDARSILGRSVASYYTGDFTFVLYDGETPIDTVTLTVDRGVASGTFALPQYVGKTATLKLVEVIPADGDKVVDMTYDAREFTINIANGAASVGRFPIVFVNTLLEPIEPSATVSKLVNTETEEATFTFNWSYEGYENADLLTPVQVSNSGTGTITVNAFEDEFFTIDLPLNFTGRLTITEDTEAALENWVYDSNTTRTIDYLLGKPVGKNATGSVSFYNNFYAPKIELDKTANSSVVLYEDINYTITVRNTGSEDLQNVVITDNMFNDSVRVLKPNEDPELDDSLLEEDEDYILDLEAGTITLLADLRQGETVFIRYTVGSNEYGSVANYASVEAERTITMGAKVEDDDENTVVVTRHESKLEVNKSVTAYVANMELDGEGVVWSSTVSFTAAGNRAAFKVTISNGGDGVLYVNSIADTFGTANLENATFYYDNGEGLAAYEGLEALLEEISQVPLYGNGDGSIVFYFISDALNTRGTFVNTVTVRVVDTYQEEDFGSDTASVTVSWTTTTGGGDPGGDPGTSTSTATIADPPTPLSEFIPEPDVPLADLPPEADLVIDEEDVPLSMMPRTGVASPLWALFGLGLSVLGLGVSTLGIRKEKNSPK